MPSSARSSPATKPRPRARRRDDPVLASRPVAQRHRARQGDAGEGRAPAASANGCASRERGRSHRRRNSCRRRRGGRPRRTPGRGCACRDGARRRGARACSTALPHPDSRIYGLNTGLGANLGTAVSGDASAFQRQLLQGRSGAVGDPLPIDIVRATMLARAAMLSVGGSGISPDIVSRAGRGAERRRPSRSCRRSARSAPATSC